MKEEVELDARNAKPAESHKLVEGDISPLVEIKAGHIAESDSSLWIVFADIPGAVSSNVEEFGDKARIFFAVLRVQLIAASAVFELLEECCRLHRKKG